METKSYNIPISIKILATCFLGVVIPVYWINLGPENLLWGCDIALIIVTIALWLENRLLCSMMAVGVFLLELIWNVDFFTRLLTGSHLFGLEATSYMFNPQIPWIVRIISFLLHVYLPAILIWLLYRLGYHHKACLAQTLLAWVVLPLSYVLTNPVDNINWVYGPSAGVQQWLPGHVYLLAMMILIPVVIYIPSHLLLNRLFGKPR